MRDILIDGIPILDLLEVTPSTSNVASLANCDQSSVSRIYRHVSESLQLEFRKSNGTYRAHTNRELLSSLRQATQLLRIQRGAEQLQWVASWWTSATLGNLREGAPLPRSWPGEQRTFELLKSRVLDLAVVNSEDLPGVIVPATNGPQQFGIWSAVPIAHYPQGLQPLLADPCAAAASAPPAATLCTDLVLVRRELLDRPAILALTQSIGQAYRQAYSHLDDIRWP
jgi:hypothetical protein